MRHSEAGSQQGGPALIAIHPDDRLAVSILSSMAGRPDDIARLGSHPVSEFVEHVLEVLEPYGTIRARRMFGGHGIYRDDMIFGLVVDDILYLKTDRESVALFQERGLGPFVCIKKGETTKTSYCMAPEEMFEDPEAAEEWLRIACDAASRFRNRPGKRRRKK